MSIPTRQEVASRRHMLAERRKLLDSLAGAAIRWRRATITLYEARNNQADTVRYNMAENALARSTEMLAHLTDRYIALRDEMDNQS